MARMYEAFACDFIIMVIPSLHPAVCIGLFINLELTKLPFGYYTPLSKRYVCWGVAELSLYVAAKYRGKNVGSALLEAVILSAEKAGLWTLQGGIFPENIPSLRLVRKHGFKEIGRCEKIGKMTYGPVLLLEPGEM